MRCNEIQEKFVDLLYREKGTPSAGPELAAHLRSCPDCQQELAELQELRSTLKAWQDEPPLRPFRMPHTEPVREGIRFPLWRLARYAAFAMLITLAFLGISNADIRWDNQGFSFRTSLLSKATPTAQQPSDYYTKEEMREIFRRVADDSQGFTFQMMQRVMDTQDQLRLTDLRFISSKLKENRSKN
jgi:hypothetical protein